MPIILYFDRFKLSIYYKDHGLPHVHVVGPGVEAKIEIESGAVVYNHGFTAKELRLALKLIRDNKELLLEEYANVQDQ